MEVKLTIRSKQLAKEELRLLIQSIRDCEQKLLKRGVVAIDGSGEPKVEALLAIGWMLADGQLEVKEVEQSPSFVSGSPIR